MAALRNTSFNRVSTGVDYSQNGGFLKIKVLTENLTYLVLP